LSRERKPSPKTARYVRSPGQLAQKETSVLRLANRRLSPWKLLVGAFIAGVIGLFLAWPIAALVRERRSVNTAARSTRIALESGRFREAEAPLERYLTARPDAAEAHALAAQLALEQGFLDRVTDELNRAKALGYPKDELERLHAITLARIGRYAEAEPILARRLAARKGPDPAVDAALARVFLMTYRLKEAEEAINRWIQDAPADGRPYLWLTEIDRRMEVDNLDTQRRHYRQALERDPELDAARLGLAETMRKLHQNAEAETEYRRYLGRHPDDAPALLGAGRNALALGDLAAAAQFFAHAAEIAPSNADVLKGRAALYLALGRARDALACLDRALAIDPFDTESYYARNRARAALGDQAGASSDLELFKKYERDHVELLAIRGSLMAHPSNNDLRSKVARWMFAHGRIDEGIGWANAVLASDPNHPAANELLAEHYAKQPKTAGLANFYRLRAAAKKP
jgi:tetratricopeptide (TPR) repeat protein